MEVIRVLLNHPDIDPNICISVMHKLKLNNKLEMLKFCLKHPTGDPNRYSADIFFDAIKQNHWDTIELLLQHPKTIINSIDLKNEIMIRSARYDNIGSMKPLLDRFRFDIDSDICIEALCEASAKGHLEIVRLLLQRTNVDPSAFDNCAIRWAAKYGHLETVKLLLQYPNVDLRALGNDAFLRAAKHGHLEMVKFIT
jgi:ankyrin repeat protein